MMENNYLNMQQKFDDLVLNIAKVNVNIVSIHGGLDDIFPVQYVKEMDNKLGENHEMILYPTEAHVCLNMILV